MRPDPQDETRARPTLPNHLRWEPPGRGIASGDPGGIWATAEAVAQSPPNGEELAAPVRVEGRDEERRGVDEPGRVVQMLLTDLRAACDERAPSLPDSDDVTEAPWLLEGARCLVPNENGIPKGERRKVDRSRLPEAAPELDRDAPAHLRKCGSEKNRTGLTGGREEVLDGRSE